MNVSPQPQGGNKKSYGSGEVLLMRAWGTLICLASLLESTKSMLGYRRLGFTTTASTCAMAPELLNVGAISNPVASSTGLSFVFADALTSDLKLSDINLATPTTYCSQIVVTIAWSASTPAAAVTKIWYDTSQTNSSYVYFLVEYQSGGDNSSIRKYDTLATPPSSPQDVRKSTISSTKTLTSLAMVGSNMIVVGGQLHYVDPTQIGISALSPFGVLSEYENKDFRFLTCSSTFCYAFMEELPQPTKLVAVDVSTLTSLARTDIPVDYQGTIQPATGLQYFTSTSTLAACFSNRCLLISVPTGGPTKWIHLRAGGLGDSMIVEAYESAGLDYLLLVSKATSGFALNYQLFSVQTGASAVFAGAGIISSQDDMVNTPPSPVSPLAAKLFRAADGLLVTFGTTAYFYEAQQCHTNCQTCNGPLETNCITCTDGNVLKDGYCQACNPSCRECLSTDINTCTSCEDGLFLVSNEATGKFECKWIEGDLRFKKSWPNAVKCTSPDCADCASDNQACEKCQSMLFLDSVSPEKCKPTISAGRFYSAVSQKVAGCSTNCSTCKTSDSNCTQCITNFGLDNTTSSCEPLSVNNVVPTGLNHLYACDPNCQSCKGTPVLCTACSPTFFAYADLNQTCLEVNFTQSYYVDSNGYNQPCSPTCRTCTNSTFCLSCRADKALQPLAGTCHDSPFFLTGFFIDYQGVMPALVFQPCPSNCDVCDSATTCTRCSSSYAVSQISQTCISCPSSHFIDLDGICKPCASTCVSCIFQSTYCSSCAVTEYLFQGMCQTIAECPIGTYSSSGQCQPCQQSCNSCDFAATNCTSCFTHGDIVATLKMDLTSYSCAVLPTDCYQKPDNKSLLVQCPSGCKSCYHNGSQPICTSCTTATKALNPSTKLCSTCATANGFFVNATGYCEPCAPLCKTCGPKSTQCTSCAATAYLLLETFSCFSSCPAGYYGVTTPAKQCQRCASNCQSCSGPLPTECTVCNPGFALDGTAPSACIICSSPTNFLDANGDTCSPALPGCKHSSAGGCGRCLNAPSAYKNSIECGDCEAGKFPRSDGICSDLPQFCTQVSSSNPQTCQTCSTSYYQDAVTQTCRTCGTGSFIDSGNKCSVCAPTCDGCSTSAATCTSCPVPSLLFVDTATNTCRPCASGKLLLAGVCQDCVPNCKECSGTPTRCTSCAGGLVLSNTNHTCAACGQGYYTSTISGVPTCFLCSANCLECQTSASNCMSCSPGSVLLPDHTCGTCGPTYFLAGIVCTKCAFPCKQCQTTKDTCTSCFTGYDLTASTCTSKCPTGQVWDATSLVCKNCASSCGSCFLTPSVCLTCNPAISNILLHPSNSLCLACGAGFVASPTGDSCLSCHHSCLTCDPTNPSKCLTCASGMYLSTETNNCISCLAGWYLTSSNQCEKCSPTCATCTGSPTNCPQCKPGFYKIQGAASTDCQVCGAGYYIDNADQCTACHMNCLRCVTSATTCTACNSPDTLSASNSTCGACGDGYFVDFLGKCVACSSNCVQCAGHSTRCTSCTPGLFLSALTSTCGSCQPGFFTPVSDPLKCLPCSLNCLECEITGSNCTKCPAEKLIFKRFVGEQYCVTNLEIEAAVSYYLDTTSTSAFLQECAPACKTCQGSPTNCLSCTNPVLYPSEQDGSCIQCGLGKGLNLNNICHTCLDANCQECPVAKDSCKVCSAGLYPSSLNKTCSFCAGSYYLDASNICRPCDPTCATCSLTSKNCTSCAAPNHFVDMTDGSCTPICVGSKTLQGQFCVACSSNCELCMINPDNCIKCSTPPIVLPSPGWYANNDSFGLFATVTAIPNSAQCAACPSNTTYRLRGRCELCPAGCSNCSNNGAKCTLCTDPNQYASDETGQCGPCPLNQGYGVTPGGVCIRCLKDCLSCTNYTGCSSCRPGKFVRPDLAHNCDVCPVGFYVNTTTQQCVPCISNCATCTGGTANDCLTCNTASGYYKLSGACTNCTAAGYYVQGQDCLQCSPTCTSCSGSPHFCTSCPTGLGLVLADTYMGHCLPVPPQTNRLITTSDGLYYRKCQKDCKECSGYEYSCTACYPGFVLVESGTVGIQYCKPLGNGTYYLSPGNSVAVSLTKANCKFSFTSATTCDVCMSSSTNFSNPASNCLIVTAGNFLAHNNHIEVCDSNCAKCEKASNICTSCATDKYIFMNNRSCGDCITTSRYFLKPFPGLGSVCTQCSSDCLSCNAAGCLMCSEGYTLQSGRCISADPLGTFTIGGINQPCDGNCRTCREAPNWCVTCNSGYLLEGATFTCVKSDTPGYFLHQDNYLYKCDTACQTCTSHAKYCTSCVAPLALHPLSGTCVTCNPKMFYLNTYGECVSCQPLCEECTPVTGFCTKCFPGHQKDEIGNCVNLGEYGVYFDTTSNLVKNCSSNCLTCAESPTHCLSCNNDIGLFLDPIDNTCKYLNAGYSGAFGFYQPCDIDCNTCERDRPFSCVTCKPGFVLRQYNPASPNRCELPTQCTNGFYLDEQQNCRPCGAGCQTCEQNTGRCTTCSHNYYKLGNTQVCVLCSDGFYVDNSGFCQKCPTSCSTCETFTMCTSCKAPTTLHLVTHECKLCLDIPGQYTTAAGDCGFCSPNCKTCSGFGFKCTSCHGSMVISRSNYTCITTCPTLGYYLDAQNICSECALDCIQCTSPEGKCTMCMSGLTPNAQGICTDCSKPGRFINNGICEDCLPGCLKCADTPDNCLLCDNIKSLYFLGSTSHECGPCDGDGLYIVDQTYCDQCDPTCKTCSVTSTRCTSCNTLKVFLPTSNECLDSCPEAHFLYQNECRRCPKNCKTCAPDTGVCASCYQPYSLFNYDWPRCILCPPGFYSTPLQICQPCDPRCVECTQTPTNCTRCGAFTGLAISSIANEKSCTACETGKLLDPTSGLCLDCDPSCQNCFNSTDTCIQCARPLYLNKGINYCVQLTGTDSFTTAPENFAKCDSSCKECAVTSSYCTSCYHGMVLSATNLTCGGCGDGYYVGVSDGNCYPCSDNCKTCSGTANTCTSCHTGFAVEQATNNCVECGSGSTISLLTGNCVLCDPPCLNCLGLPNRCTSCESGTYLLMPDQTCGLCGDGYFIDLENNCRQCNSNCATCQDAADMCTSCISGLYVSEKNYTCSACGDGYFVSGVTCKQCSANCRTCQSTATTCTGCLATLYLTYPAQTCTDCSASGTTLVAGECRPCVNPCAECSLRTTNCTACHSPGHKVLVAADPNLADNTCGVCNDPHRFIGPNGWCWLCSSNCLTCSGSITNCTSCSAGQYVRRDQANICASTCPSGLFVEVLSSVSYCDTCPVPCATCTNRVSCQTCIPGYYMSGTSCLPCTDINCATCDIGGTCSVCKAPYSLNSTTSLCSLTCPVGRYWDGSACSLCDPSCLECSGSAASCTKCAGGKYLYPNTTCDSCSQDGWFVAGSLCSACHNTCLRCTSEVIQACTSCPLTAKLQNGTCVTLSGIPVVLHIEAVAEPASGSDISYKILAPPGWLKSGEAADLIFWQALNSVLTLKLESRPKDDPSAANSSMLVSRAFYPDPAIGIHAKFRTAPTKREYLVLIDYNTTGNFEYKQKEYRIIPNTSSLVWLNPQDSGDLESAQGQGAAAGALMGGFGGGGGTGTTIVGTLMVLAAGDPTGTLSKFSQLIKLNSKLVYLSVEYGPLQKTFLETADTAAGTLRYVPNLAVERSNRAYRGRLSFYKVLLEADKELLWKMLAYCGCWLLKGLSMYVMSRDTPVSRGVLVVLYFLPKLHLMVFNLVLVDFAFYLTRTALHSLNTWSVWWSQLVLLLIFADLCEILGHVISDPDWRSFYDSEISMKREDELLDETIKQLESKHQPEAHQKPLELPGIIERSPKASDSIADLNLTQNEEATFEKLVTYKKTTETVLQKYKDPGQMIDFRGTFRNIQRNPHLLGLMTDQIKCEKSVYSSLLCRTGFLFHCLRLSIYQIIVIVGQYMTTTSVVILIVLEASRIVMTSVLYAKKKHYKQVLLFLLDVMQSVFMLIFLLFASGYIHRDSKTSPISKSEQQGSVYLVMAASVVEYLLLISYGIQSLIQKLRRWRKYKQLQKYRKTSSVWEFLVLDVPRVTQPRLRSQNSEIHDLSAVSQEQLVPQSPSKMGRRVPAYRAKFGAPLAKPRLEQSFLPRKRQLTVLPLAKGAQDIQLPLEPKGPEMETPKDKTQQVATRAATPRDSVQHSQAQLPRLVKKPVRVAPLGLSELSEIVLRPIAAPAMDLTQGSPNRDNAEQTAAGNSPVVFERKANLIFADNRDAIRATFKEVKEESATNIRPENFEKEESSKDLVAPAVQVKHQVKSSSTTDWILNRMGLKKGPSK